MDDFLLDPETKKAFLNPRSKDQPIHILTCEILVFFRDGIKLVKQLCRAPEETCAVVRVCCIMFCLYIPTAHRPVYIGDFCLSKHAAVCP